MGKSPASINLMQRKKTNADIFLEWALTTGRFIIILTETIALGAFFYRFTLDSQIIDLHDKIKNNEALIAYYHTDEVKARTLHAKLASLSDLEANADVVPSLTNKIIGMATGKVVLQSLILDQQTMQLTATTPSISLMNSFVSSLKQDPAVATVSVDQVQNEPDTGTINISITATFITKKGVSQNG